jgi:hypothetical protein
MFPELPDAKMETRNPIADSSQENLGPKGLSYGTNKFSK